MYKKKIALQQLQGGQCNEFDSSSFEFKGFWKCILVCYHNF